VKKKISKSSDRKKKRRRNGGRGKGEDDSMSSSGSSSDSERSDEILEDPIPENSAAFRPSLLSFYSPPQPAAPAAQGAQNPQLVLTATNLAVGTKIVNQMNTVIFGEECLVTCDEEEVRFTRWLAGRKLYNDFLVMEGEGTWVFFFEGKFSRSF
jgi:hypothetical protein